LQAVFIGWVFNVCIWAQTGVPTARLEQAIRQEMKKHALPALSIALVDNQQVVWAEGFGMADAARKVPATADTIYRVGSVSKLFTDTAIMQLVEKGELDLDAPITRYLSDFHPSNPFGKPITLRELMAHRSGLVREPPVGHYFDSSARSLKATVDSLNGTTLVYPPGAHTKYSNAAIAVAGYVLEKQSGRPFTDYVRDAVLKPLGMNNSAFTPTPEIMAKLAKASIWTYDGRVFDAPTFELGMAPAGCMYSSVMDLSKFVSMLFAGGGSVLKAETLQRMWQPQFAEPNQQQGFGIGFRIGSLDGHQLVGHGGAIYGFATDTQALPADKLGVVVVTTMDSASAPIGRIVSYALRLMLAGKNGTPMPKFEETQPVPLPLARAAAAGHI
jgi:serine beta-lactamase-like protein LACTB